MEADREAMEARWAQEAAERHARHVEAGRKAAAARWAKAGSMGPTVQVRICAGDAEVLRRMVHWRGRGLCVAATLARLLQAAEGVLWARGAPTASSPAGRPQPLPPFWRTGADGGASHE